MARPWTKWYFADWRGDPRLRMCGLPARGLWADILSYMHEGEPYGHFTIDGRVPELPDIARLVGAPVREVSKAFAELERHGVFSRTDAGTPYSRRMLKDMERDALQSERGKLGGNPALKAGVNPQLKPQKPESRKLEPESDSNSEPGLGFVGSPSGKPKTQKRAIAWTEDDKVPGEWKNLVRLRRAMRGLPAIDLELEADKFEGWAVNAKPKKNWRLAFKNWCLNAKGIGNGTGQLGRDSRPAYAKAVDSAFADYERARASELQSE